MDVMLLSTGESLKTLIRIVAKDVLKDKDFAKTWYIDFARDEARIWSVVMCWSQEGDEEFVLAKVGYRAANSLMTEYDIDFVMPYNEETSEVDDLECMYYPGTQAYEIANDMYRAYEHVMHEYLLDEDEEEVAA